MTLPVYTTQKLSKTRVAIFEDGEYLCQLQPKEVSGWIARAEASAKKFAEDEAEIRVYRIAAAREYLAKRAIREAAAPKQLELF